MINDLPNQANAVKESVLLIHDNTATDNMVATLLSAYCQMTGASLTIVDVNSPRIHALIRAAFEPGVTQMYCNTYTFMNDLTEYEAEAVTYTYHHFNDACQRLGRSLPNEILRWLRSLNRNSDISLGFAMFYELFKKLGTIDAANFVAERIIADPNWNICRDPEVMDWLDPPRKGDDA